MGKLFADAYPETEDGLDRARFLLSYLRDLFGWKMRSLSSIRSIGGPVSQLLKGRRASISS
jgi:hypothetical protein